MNPFALEPGTDAGFRLRPGTDAASAVGTGGGASITGTGNAFTLTTLVPTGASDVIFSADQTLLYVAMRNGDLKVFNVATGANVATWDIGTHLGGISLSEDGSFLLVTERQIPGTSSILYKVATATGTAETFSLAGQAFYDVEIVDSNTAIVSGGQSSLTRFHLATSTFSSLPGGFYSNNNTVLSEGSRYTLLAETGISPGPMHLYDDVLGAVVTHASHQGVNWGTQAVSEAAGMIVDFYYYGSFTVYNLNLQYQRDVNPGERLDGFTFDRTGQYAYAYLIDSGVIATYYTGDWTEVDRVQVGTSQWHNNVGFGGQLHLDDSGKILTILDADANLSRLQILDFRIRDETFAGTIGADVFEGGKGDDVYLVNHAGDTIIEKIHEGRDRVETSISYTLGAGQHIEILSAEINGGSAALQLTGNELGQEIRGNAGANVLTGLGGNDILIGGGGADTLIGGTGNDIYRVEDSGDVVVEAAGEGVDSVSVALSLASYALAAGVEVEILSAIDTNAAVAMDLTGNEFANRLYGTAGANLLIGGGGADMLFGGAGNDVYRVEEAGDLVIEAGGGGADIVHAMVSYALAAGSEVESLFAIDPTSILAMTLTGNEYANAITGNAGNNELNGGGGADTLIGAGGNDSLDGGSGVDDMSGGQGNDTYIVDNGADVVRELAGEGSDLVYVSTSYALAAGQEIEVLSTRAHGGTDPINLIGNDYAQTIYGNAAANVIDGRGGADVMAGFGGNDTYVVDNAGDQVLEGLGQGNDSIVTSVSYVLSSNQEIETLSTQTHAGTDDLFLTGNQYSNKLIGNAGNNILNGVGGADVMIGLAGDDTYAIDDLGDLVIDLENQGNDLVLTYLSHTLTNGNQIETLSTVFHQGTDAINLGGNDYNNTLIGNYGANYLNGNGGVDVMIGLYGDDTYVADNAGDVVQEVAGGGSDLLYSFVSYALAAGQEVEIISTAVQGSTTAINLTGNEYAQTIVGNAGANILDGKSGNDTLYGLGGADTFAFTTALGAGNVDTIADFVAGTDKIGLDDAIFTAIGATLNANAFVIGTAAGDADDRIIYNSATGALLYDADGVGGAAAVQFATLSTGLALSAGDFMVI